MLAEAEPDGGVLRRIEEGTLPTSTVTVVLMGASTAFAAETMTAAVYLPLASPDVLSATDIGKQGTVIWFVQGRTAPMLAASQAEEVVTEMARAPSPAL